MAVQCTTSAGPGTARGRVRVDRMGCSEAEDASRRLDGAIDEFIAFLAGLPAAGLDVMVPPEERSVRVMAYHVASGLRLGREWLDPAREGKPVPGDDIDAYNAVEAREHAGATPEEVLAIIERERGGAAEAVRSLTAEQWALSVPFGPGGGVELPVSRLATAGERHVTHHLANIREALAAAGTPAG